MNQGKRIFGKSSTHREVLGGQESEWSCSKLREVIDKAAKISCRGEEGVHTDSKQDDPHQLSAQYFVFDGIRE